MKPIVRIIEPEQIETKIITGEEAERILNNIPSEDKHFSTRIEPLTKPQSELTFEEMIKQHEDKMKAEEAKRVGPQPKTFNGNGGWDSEVKYGTESESGFGFKIEISTDMKLPRY